MDKRKIRDLAACRFIEDGQNIIFLGPPGVGKTHLAVALGLEAIAQGYPVLFTTVSDLMTALGKAHDENRLAEKMKKTYLKPRLLILDEIGYLPLSPLQANFLFQLVSQRYEKGSVILTSNKSYGDLGIHLQGQRHRQRHPRPVAPPQPHRQYQGRELPAQGKEKSGNCQT